VFTRTALARTEARSLPASGSDHACAQISSARAIGGSSRSHCSAVPCRISVGASRNRPFCPARTGAAAAWYSSSKTSHSSSDAPRPP
jgi:hypothetical protein